MQRNYKHICWLAAIGLLWAGPAFVLGQMDTNFTYQGQLIEAGEPVTDLVTMRFSLWNAASSGSQLGSDYTASSVDVVDGLFTVQVDSANFGASGFNGDPRWLEIEVYDAGWQTLSPRQPITPAPYALALPGLRTEPSTDAAFPEGPIVIGGFSGNSTTHGVVGATIAGGGIPGYPNRALGDFRPDLRATDTPCI